MSRFIRGTAIGAGLLLASIGQTYALEDTTPPQLANMIINTPVIDTSNASAVAKITLRVRDDISGVHLAVAFSRGPTGLVTGGLCNMISGNKFDAIFECNRAYPFKPDTHYI